MAPSGMTIWARQIPNTDSIQQTFSSWDKCMSQAYCKWPAIVGIILASIVVLSILACIVNCLCIGAECCCCCVSCFRSCCPGFKRRQDNGAKYADPPPRFPPSQYQGYQPTPAPPVYGPSGPQYAQFDVSNRSNANDDALPAMPSWDTSPSKQIIDEQKEEVEMNRLDSVHEQSQPMLPNQAPTPRTGYDAHSPGLPYQQYGAQNGGDLGSPYELQGPANPAGDGFAAAAGYGGQQRQYRPNYERQQSYGNQPSSSLPQQGQGRYYGQDTYQSQQPQRSYSGYAPSEVSTRYEASTNYNGQESGVVYGSRPAPVGRRPVNGSWREV